MAFENDYTWLLKTLATNSANINYLYNLKVKIPEMILLQGGDPKVWFYQEKDHIKMRNENYLKMKLVKEYFIDPQSINDPQVFDFDYQMYALSKNNAAFDDKKVLFCVYMEQASKNIKTVKKITKKVADDLFSTAQESTEFCKSWTRIFSYIPNKTSGLYDVSFTKGLKDENPKIKILKKDYSLKNIEISDYRKDNTRRDFAAKEERPVPENNFFSIASNINAALEKTAKGIVRFLEGKTKLNLGEIHLEIIVDNAYTTWLVGCSGISFYNQEGTLEKDADKESIVFPKSPLKQFFTCSGSYCKFDRESNFYQEGDEAINLYSKKRPQKEIFEISFKSLILDVIERCKHIHRMQENLPEFDLKYIVHYAETHPFDFRKYYSIGEILDSYLFKAYKVSNLYKTVRVCRNCHFIYEKIDGYRVQKILKPENRKFNKEEATQALDKYYERNTPSTLEDTDKKAVFSKLFYKKLEVFDKNILELLGLERQVETVEDFFELTSEKMRRMSPVTPRDPLSLSKYGSASPSTVRFPKITKEIIRDPQNLIKHEKLKITDKIKAENVGYKHYLGHAKNLGGSEAGHILSKSSIKLNRLQDKINRMNLVIGGSVDRYFDKEDNESQRGSEMEGFKVKIDLIKDNSHSSDIKDKLEEIKALEASLQVDKSTMNRARHSILNVVVDKFDFISEKERNELFDKEQKKKERETQQKDFLATNNLLAQSISNRASLKNPPAGSGEQKGSAFGFDDYYLKV